MVNLTERQRGILEFIASFVNDNKVPPTIREIGDSVGISSTSVVNYNLAKLEEHRLISRRKEVSRGIIVNWDRVRELDLDHGMRGYNGLGLLKVPILGTIAAGEPIGVQPQEPTNPLGWVDLASDMLRTQGDLFALRVRGDSMIDASVLNGDVVILHHQDTADDGDMVAAWIEGDEETTLKYLYHEGREVRLQPANPSPEYKPIVRPAEKVRINGKVVAVIRML